MGKGQAIPIERGFILILGVLLSVLGIMLVVNGIEPIGSPEAEAIEYAYSLPIYLTSLSTIEEGRIEVDIKNPLDIELIHLDGFSTFEAFKAFLTDVKNWEIRGGIENLRTRFDSFNRKGYYVFITPYRAETRVGKEDYYHALGVERDASQNDISKAFNELRGRFGPDVVPRTRQAEIRFEGIKEAFYVLNDPEKRKSYDRFGSQGLEKRPFEASYILAYPEEEVDGIEKSFIKPESICIIKERGKELAVMSECAS